MPASDIDPNLVIQTSGVTATVATDAVVFSGATAHFQLIKMAYGLTGAATLVSSTNPLPVSVTSSLTANVSGFTGTFTIQGTPAGTPVPVTGTVIVTGTTSTPVYVSNYTGSKIEVTGGRPSGKTTDSISVFGPNGNTWIYANLVNSSGTQLGNSANPLYTILSGATLSVTVNPTVGVTNDSGSGLKIQGFSGGIAVATTVGGTVAINDTLLYSGLTQIYGAINTLNTNLGVLGISRPTNFVSGRSTITTGVTGMYPSGYTTIAGVNIRASSSNTDLVYLNSDGVALVGYELEPGENIFLNVQNLNKIYLRAKTSSQIISYMAS